MKTCPECDTPTTADAATCVVCGARFDQAAPEPDDAAGPADLPQDVASDTTDQEADVPTETTTQTDPMNADPEAPLAHEQPVPPPSQDQDQVAWPAAAPPGGGQSGRQAPPLPPSAPPAPDAIALDESVRNWGLLAHVSGLVSSAMVGMGFVGPLIVWVLKRDDHPFVAQNAAEALNFQLSMLLYGILLVVASLPVITLLVTLPLALVGFLLWLLLPIVAAVKASKGESWTYPITIGFVRP